MRTVHCILMALLLAAAAGCASDPVVPVFPGHMGEEPAVVDDVDAPQHPGFTSDRKSRSFHRVDCPLVEKIPLRDQEHFDTPWQALNQGYAPCGTCDPQAGWK